MPRSEGFCFRLAAFHHGWPRTACRLPSTSVSTAHGLPDPFCRNWNINSVRLRVDQVERFLTEQAPDVLCSAGSPKLPEALFPHEMFERLGYTHRAVHGQKGYHGVATVSRLPLREVSRHDWQADGEARHVGVERAEHGTRHHSRERLVSPQAAIAADPEANPSSARSSVPSSE